MNFPPLDPLASLHSRVAAWAGSVLLDSVADDSCPRCLELESGARGWGGAHLHTDAEKGAAILSAYQTVNHLPAVNEALWRTPPHGRGYWEFPPGHEAYQSGRDKASTLRGSASVNAAMGGHELSPPAPPTLARAVTVGFWSWAIGGPQDPLGPVGLLLGDIGAPDPLPYKPVALPLWEAPAPVLVAPVAIWQASEDARMAARAARRLPEGSRQDKALRLAAADAARSPDAVEPDVLAWHAQASQAWQAWQADLELADSFVPFIPVPTQEKAGLSWH